MKRALWGVLMFLLVMPSGVASAASGTQPTTNFPVNGPFVISAYGFTGPNLTYIQLFNTSTGVASLDDWAVTVALKSAMTEVKEHTLLHGMVAPKQHIVVAIPGMISHHALDLSIFVPLDSTGQIGSVGLRSPQPDFLDEAAIVPTINASTIREQTPNGSMFHVRRSPSTSTGNTYLSSYGFTSTAEGMMSDDLYVPPPNQPLSIVEVYADASTCGPFDVQSGCADYVKVYNSSSAQVDMSEFRIRTGAFGQTASASNTAVMSGILQPGRYAAFNLSLSGTGSWVWLEDSYGIRSYESSLIQYPSSSEAEGQAWSFDTETVEWKWTPELSPFDQPNRFAPAPVINDCSGVRLNEVAANAPDEDQFIEVINAGSQPVDITGCALQTNRSETRSHVFAPAVLQPGEIVATYVQDTDLLLTKTTSGTVYLLSSDLQTEVDQVSYADLKSETSWAVLNDQWTRTYAVTPGESNVVMEYPACEDGYTRNFQTGLCNKDPVTSSGLAACETGKYRNPDTNRCRSISSSGSSLTPCLTGQYRNPQTNRCRSLVTTSSVLTPCQAGQERNPATNRCRSVGAASTLKPCAVNQERNPTTNRCKNSTAASIADFPVETVAQASEATIGWWAFGGVGLLALSYAGWEWRYEVASAIRKAGSLVKLGK